MKLIKSLTVVVIIMVLLFNTAFTLAQDHGDGENALVKIDEDTDDMLHESEELSPSSRQVSRFLAQRKAKKQLSCDKFPRICRNKGSAGPDCCKKKCVNVTSDRQNCGMCGNKCRYSQICCKGKCVNPSFDKKNCGGCNKQCKKGEFCSYGMCNYA